VALLHDVADVGWHGGGVAEYAAARYSPILL